MFKGKLFKSQKEGAQFLCAKKYGILSWEQGTGKTIISIASAEKLRELNLVSSILVLAPSSITWQWNDRLDEFTDAQTTLIHSKSQLRGSYETTTPYTVTSYNLFRRDFQAIVRHSWDLVICDEAQEFKNNRSKLAKLLKALNVEIRPKYKWALTGTVISNKLEELYSIMYWVDRNFFPAWDVFEKRHIVRNSNTKQIMRYKGLQAINAGLPSRLSRKTQEEVGDMPELLIDTHYIEKEKELKDAERDLLDSLNDAVLSFDPDGHAPSFSPEATQAFHRVKELLASPKKLSYAADLCHRLLLENPRNRCVIFSHFKPPLYALADTLSNRSVNSHLFTGNEDSDTKRDAVRAFERQASVLLCSNAGKAGLDLPFANYVIHIDVPFSFGILDQRNKRITRATSSWTSVKAIYLVVKNSIEEYYLKQTDRKENLSNAVYTGHTDTVTMKTQSLRQFLDAVT